MTSVSRNESPSIADLYATIWRQTGRQQRLLIVLSLVLAVLAAAPLKFQQLIVNSLVERGDIRHLGVLCLGFFAAILLSAALKFYFNYRLSVLGERAIWMIRERLYTNYVSDTIAGETELPKRGTLMTMLTSEAEAVGSFAGSAIAWPMMLLGTLASVVGFIIISQPWLGVIACVVVVPQAVIIVNVQGRINSRVKERVQALRDASDRISDSDMKQIEAEISEDFDRIYTVRRKIFFLKLSVKFIISSLSAIGAVGILFVGGWLVIQGRSDVGTVVASLTGLTRIEGPWRELVAFFRNASTVRVQFAMLFRAIEQRPTVQSGSVS
jgi:ABC-type bacteriocin/lantibiotic exporter with double-glycine peptidase domain